MRKKRNRKYNKQNAAKNQGIYGINAKKSNIPVTRTGSDLSIKVKAIKS